SAFAKSFPKSRLVVVFQPHTYSRTKCLFDEFAKAFSRAHTVILTDIYASAREEPDPSVNSRQLGEVMKGHTSEVVYLPGASDVVEYMNQNSFGKDTIVITMGAGDIYKISEELKVKS
ncbi:MAG TPA: cyanophycin synthetase, partial [Candidatus Saccharimonadales bacterium]|nr:cyanophycin synthetase [Candidatus Saccharimonadales bacterium]